MKILLTILLSFPLLVTGQVDNVNGKWVAVFCRPIGDNWIRPIDGMILDLKQNTVTIGYVYSDSLATFNLKKRKNRIEIDNKPFCKIHFISSDSLVLDFSDKMRVRFVSIRDYNPRMESIDLTKNSWTLKSTDYSTVRRIDFLNERWRNSNRQKLAITHQKTSVYKYQERERWALNSILNEWFLPITQYDSDPTIYQVKKAYDDSLKLTCLNWPNISELTLVKNKNLDQDKIDAISSYLSQKKWKTIEVLNYSTSFTGDTIDVNENFSKGHYSIDTTLIDRKDLLDRNLSFNFRSDFVFEIFVNSILFWETEWRITPDGIYIVLNKGLKTSDYIEIISTEDNQLSIGKSDHFGTGKKWEYIPYYYELKLQ